LRPWDCPSLLSQSPEGSTVECHRSEKLIEFGNSWLSQSPEGSTFDFHLIVFAAAGNTSGVCLNPPKGPRSISTRRANRRKVRRRRTVSIPRRVHVRFPRRHVPPIDPRHPHQSQSPEGSTFDFHSGLRKQLATTDGRSLNPPKGPRSIST